MDFGHGYGCACGIFAGVIVLRVLSTAVRAAFSGVVIGLYF